MPSYSKNKKTRPKCFEKMLLANIVQDKVLERTLAYLNNESSRRMKELDLECKEMKNEMKSSQRNRSLSKTSTQVPPAKYLLWSHSREDDIQKTPMSKYLLSEYTRTAAVIPSILHSLYAKEEEEKDVGSCHTKLISPTRETSSDPDIGKILRLAKNVRKLQETMEIRKQRVNNKMKLSFKDILRSRLEKDGESDIYTDGVCSLLRRKMLKIRRNSLPAIPETSSNLVIESKRNFSLPLINTRRSVHQSAYLLPRVKSLPVPLSHFKSTLTTQVISEDRLSTKDDTASVEKQVIAQRKASEEKNFDKIQMKINSFLDDVSLKRYCSTVSNN